MTDVQTKKYPVDVTGKHKNNLVVNEPHDINAVNRVIVPRAGKFYEEGLIVQHNGRTLEKGRDYRLVDLDDELMREVGKAIFNSIVILNTRILTTVYITYQCYGSVEYSKEYLNELKEKALENREWLYSNIIGLPDTFPPSPHRHPTSEIDEWNALSAAWGDMNQLLSALKFASNKGVLLELSKISNKLSNKMISLAGEMEEIRERGRALDDIRTHVDTEIARLHEEVRAMSDYERFSDLVNRRVEPIRTGLDSLQRDTHNRIQETINRIPSDIQVAIHEYDRTIKDWTSGSIGQLDDRFVLRDNLNETLSGYAPLSSLTALSETLAGYVSLSTLDAKLEALKKKVRYEDLLDKPRGMFYNRDLASHYDTTTNKFDWTEGYYAHQNEFRRIHLSDQHGTRRIIWIEHFNNLNVMPAIIKGVINSDNKSVITNKITSHYFGGFDYNAPINLVEDLRFGSYTKNDEQFAILANRNNNADIGFAFNDNEVRMVTRSLLNGNYHYSKGERLLTMTDYNNVLEVINQRISRIDVSGLIRNAMNNLNDNPALTALQDGLNNKVNNDKVQSNLTDYTTDKLPKFHTGGVLSVKKLLVDNKITLSASGNELNIDRTIRIPNYVVTSDKRLKDDITPIEDALNVIKHIGGYTYSMNGLDGIQSGVIAQEVKSVLPHLVKQDDDGYLGVHYSSLIPYLIEAIKTLSQEKNTLEERVRKLEEKLGV